MHFDLAFACQNTYLLAFLLHREILLQSCDFSMIKNNNTLIIYENLMMIVAIFPRDKML
ncbi:hypothetical protein HanRHA438_Chr14g0660811 [Helianthus annuus]|nr:hypothetical protein HanRHA438_Chr14g0660811 [Helianthus annuus]